MGIECQMYCTALWFPVANLYNLSQRIENIKLPRALNSNFSNMAAVAVAVHGYLSFRDTQRT